MNVILIEHSSDGQDPQDVHTKKHLLLDVYTLSICGMLSESES